MVVYMNNLKTWPTNNLLGELFCLIWLWLPHYWRNSLSFRRPKGWLLL